MAHLTKIPLFQNLPPEELEALAQIARQTKYPEGSVLFYEGDPSSSFLVILDGELEVIKNFGSDAELHLAKLRSGEYLGEMSLFMRTQQRSASIRAARNSEVIEFPRNEFESLLTRHPGMAFHLMQEMSLRMRNQDRLTLQDLTIKNQQLEKAYNELKEAQAQIIAQEKIKYELAMARTIQESLLPKGLPDIPGWRLAAHWEPARAVSGDFYDFLQLPHHRLGIVVGDVTDKGVPAALVMAVTRSVLRAVARSTKTRSDQCPSPAILLEQMNDVLQPDMPMSMFVTCIFAVLDLQTGCVRYATAGHPPPYHITDQGVQELKGRGAPLGLLPDRTYNDLEVYLQTGDRLLFFSDGLIEAHDPQGRMFSESRLNPTMLQLPGAEIIPCLMQELADFTGVRSEPEDDVTLVTLERI
jgi:serine phosphatase RsbU (regulator of sigma subunit)